MTGLIALLGLETGCTVTSKATDFNHMATPYGEAEAHLHTSRYAIHFAFVALPFLGDARLSKTWIP